MKILPYLSIAFAAAALAGCGGKGQKDAAGAAGGGGETAVRVRAAKAEVRAFEARLAVQGSVEAKTSVNVSARIPGNLDTVWVDEGDDVVAGETRLFQIDPVSLSNQVVVAEQALAVAKSNLAVGEASLESVKAADRKTFLDFARFERLHEEGRVTDNEFEQSQTQRLQSEASVRVGEAKVALTRQQVEQAAAQLTIARKTLADSLIVAPLTGKVSLRAANPGEFVGAGQPILTIVDVGALEAAAFIPAQYFSRVKAGQTSFRLAEAGRDLGKVAVAYKSPVVSTTLRTFEIKGLLSRGQAAALAPGMLVDMTLVFDERSAAGVPSGAVLIRGGKSIVFVAEGGRAVRRVIETGYQNDGWTEVTSGLKPGDAVIYEGHTLVRDGGSVEIMK